MAKDPGIGHKIIATITDLKGECNAGHKVGDKLEISCHNPAGLCGFFYHDIFPTISTLQFGGTYPWGDPDTVEVECPDRYNVLKAKLERVKRP